MTALLAADEPQRCSHAFERRHFAGFGTSPDRARSRVDIVDKS